MTARPVALITGAARGIGRAIAQDLARDHHIPLTYHNSDPTELQDTLPGHLAIRTDLRQLDTIPDILARTLDRFGRIDVLINNAGLVRADDDPARADINTVNLLAPMALLDAVLPHLKPGASVINISSVNAVLPAATAAAYSASKAALNTWTRAAAKQHGPAGIRVNAVAPGATEIPDKPRSAELVTYFTDHTALGRVATPEDIAKAVRFFASDAARFVTGQVLHVDGGYRL